MYPKFTSMYIRKKPSPFDFLLFSCLILFGTMLPSSLEAQQRFKGGLIAGFTASQINGDESNGYNKLGLQAGTRVEILLGERTSTSLELLFAQRGSQSELIKDQFSFQFFSLTLNYIDVPVQFHFKDWLVDNGEEEFYRISVSGGFCYSRLISTSSKDELSAVTLVAPLIRKDDYNYVLGVTYNATPHLGFTFRTIRGLGLMYNPTDHAAPPEKDSWYNHSLYFQAVYTF